MIKERARNKLPNYSEGFLFPAPLSREEHSRATQRLREWSWEQKNKLESGSYFVHVPKPKSQIGFTLIEVMVALVIIATALAATVKVVGNATSNASYLVDTSFAQWVALNELEKIKIDAKWVGVGESSGSAKMGDRDWYWQRNVKTTPDKDVNRIEMSVSNNKDDDSSLVTVTGFISRPTAAAQQTP